MLKSAYLPTRSFFMANVLLGATTSATQSGEFVVQRPSEPATIVVSGLAGAETAQVQIYDPITSAFVDALGIGAFTATVHAVMIEAPGRYRVDKDATVAAVGVTEHTRYNP
jgi:hypothetical protein